MATDKQRGDTGPGGERKAAPPRRGDAAGATQNNKVVKAQLHQLTVTFFCDSICRRTNDFLPSGTTRVVNTSMEQRKKKWIDWQVAFPTASGIPHFSLCVDQ